MSRKLQLLIFAAIILLSACSSNMRFFTAEMQDVYGWTENEMKQIQFYLSDDIVLQRSLRQGESVITGGKIRIEEGRQIEEIVFEEGTPGVLLFIPKENRMAISFEGDEEYLMFGASSKLKDRYVLLASDWDQRTGTVTYHGKKYQTSSKSAFAGLLVDMSKINKVNVKRKKASGRTISR